MEANTPTPPAPRPAPTLRELEQYVQLGDVVFWYPYGETSLDAHTAIVTGLGMDTAVDLTVLQPKLTGRISIDGARHADDKETRSEELRENGCWRHKPETIAMRLLLIQGGLLHKEPSGEVYDLHVYVNLRNSANEKKAAAKAAAK